MEFKELLKNRRTVSFFALLGAVGILLIFLSDIIPKSSKKGTDETVESETYKAQLQSEITELVKSITGDKYVTALVTLESGTEYVYATERNSNSGTKENKESTEKYNNEISDKTEETYIIIKTDNGEQPLLLSALAPSVRGVAIVCDSAANGVVADNIKQAVCTLLDISEKRVSVTGY